MPTATLTSKGQITVPKAIRERLRLRKGDAVDFLIVGNEVHIRAGSVDVLELKGMLKKPGRKAVSLEAMDQAIQSARRRVP